MKLFDAVAEAKRAATKQTEQNESIPTFTIDDYPVRAEPVRYWIKNDLLSLRQSDLAIIESGEWLTDNIIHAAQKVLARQFQGRFHGAGFQDPVLSQRLSFDIETSGFVQILHNGHNHWLLASTIGCAPGCVSIYDSLYSNCSAHVQENLACLPKHSETNLLLNFQDKCKTVQVTVEFFLLPMPLPYVLECSQGKWCSTSRACESILLTVSQPSTSTCFQ